MARNMVQFQKGLSVAKFLEKYGNEAACRDAVFKLRWPEGFRELLSNLVYGAQAAFLLG